MDMYQLKWTRLQSEIFRFLCIKAGASFNLRGIAKPLKVTPTAVSNALAGLKGLVNIRKSETMNLFSIELNRDNPEAIDLKRVENLKLMYETGFAGFLSEKFPGCTIVLFGSYSRGEDVLNSSDIDIAVIGAEKKEVELENFEKLLERKIILNFYTSLKEIHKNLKENIFNGILLKGGFEL